MIKHFLEVNGSLSQPNGQIFKQNASCVFIGRYFCWYVSYLSLFGPIQPSNGSIREYCEYLRELPGVQAKIPNFTHFDVNPAWSPLAIAPHSNKIKIHENPLTRRAPNGGLYSMTTRTLTSSSGSMESLSSIIHIYPSETAVRIKPLIVLSNNYNLGIFFILHIVVILLYQFPFVILWPTCLPVIIEG